MWSKALQMPLGRPLDTEERVRASHRPRPLVICVTSYLPSQSVNPLGQSLCFTHPYHPSRGLAVVWTWDLSSFSKISPTSGPRKLSGFQEGFFRGLENENQAGSHGTRSGPQTAWQTGSPEPGGPSETVQSSGFQTVLRGTLGFQRGASKAAERVGLLASTRAAPSTQRAGFLSKRRQTWHPQIRPLSMSF